MPLATAPLARFIEAAGQVRGAWYDAKAHYSESLYGKPHKLHQLDSAQEVLDDAVAEAESILKDCAKLMQAEKGFPESPALSSVAPPSPDQGGGRGLAGSETKGPRKRLRPSRTAKPNEVPPPPPPPPPCPPLVAPAAETRGKRKIESVDWDSQQSKQGSYRSPAEWKIVTGMARQAKAAEKWTPDWNSPKDFYSKILPERLACLSQARLCDLLLEAIETWLRKRSKKDGNIRETDTAHLDQVWNSPKLKSIMPFINPPIHSLRNWISENMEDASVYEGDDGKLMLSRRHIDENDAEEEERYQEELNEFIEALPEDRLTDEEEELREALLSFLENWQGDSAPQDVDAYNTSYDRSIKVYLAMCLFLPRRIKLRDWIFNRIGGEVEVVVTDSGKFLHLVS